MFGHICGGGRPLIEEQRADPIPEELADKDRVDAGKHERPNEQYSANGLGLPPAFRRWLRRRRSASTFDVFGHGDAFVIELLSEGIDESTKVLESEEVKR